MTHFILWFKPYSQLSTNLCSYLLAPQAVYFRLEILLDRAAAEPPAP